MNKPVIMISSTFFDLKLVRNELHQFIEGMGYESLLSENATFPIDTDLNTLENCKKKVELYADILILIIGGRYGYVDEKSGKSITNLEYIEARNKGIPIYVFIENNVLTAFELWNKNKDNDFSSVVDAVEVFNFIERIRNMDSIWTFPFNIIKDIENVLTIQFSYLFKQSLDDRIKIKKTENELFFNTLSTQALLLAVEKPQLWEYRLFFQVWIDENDKNYEKIYTYKQGLKFLRSDVLAMNDFASWGNLKFHEMEGYIENANVLVGKLAQEAFGPEGCPGNASDIIMVAKNLAKVLDAILDWCIDIHRIKSDVPLMKVISILSKMPTQMINEMISFPKQALEKTVKALQHIHDEKPYQLEMTMVFRLLFMDEFQQAMDEFSNYYIQN